MQNAWILFHSDISTAPAEAEECLRLQEEGYQLGVSFKILDQSQFELLVDDKGKWQAFYQGAVIDAPEFILVRSGAETNYTGFAVLRFYEQLGVPLCNTLASVERSVDKLYAQKILGQSGIPMPRSMLARSPLNTELVEERLGFPVVVKVLKGTRGKGIMLAENAQQLRDLSDFIEAGPDTPILLQHYINASHGRDLRAFVIDGKVVACMERKSADGSFKSNISLGGNGVKHDITPEIEKLATEAAAQLGLGVAGVDLLFDEDGYKVCEVNSAPGMSIEKICDLNIAKMVVQNALKNCGKNPTLLQRLKGYIDNAA